MTQKKPSADEIKAAAESAIAARAKATEAKRKADEAGGVDEDLNSAAADAEQVAKDAESDATALSQQVGSESGDKTKKVEKLRRKRQYINRELQQLGAGEDGDLDDDDDDQDDPDAPPTRRELSQKKADELIEAIEDPEEQAAVREALSLVNPDVLVRNPAQAVQVAKNTVYADRNRKIIEEGGRKPAPVRIRSGAGAPAKREGEVFEPTADEAKYMRPPFNLTEADVKAAREQGA